MYRTVQAIALIAVAVLAVACGGGGATSAPATAAPSTGPSGSATPDGSVLSISAKDTAYSVTTLTAKADTPFQIAFDNQDSAPHNIAIKDASGAQKFKGDIVAGQKVSYDVGALAAGTYTFWCEVHPNMTGTLTVQ
jgi:plastocyanin